MRDSSDVESAIRDLSFYLKDLFTTSSSTVHGNSVIVICGNVLGSGPKKTRR